MSLRLHIHLGPYVECKYRPAKREVTVNGCTDPTCHSYKERSQWSVASGFCSKCGGKKGPSKMLVDDRPEYIEVIKGQTLTCIHDEDSREKDKLFLIPNITLPGEPKCLSIKSGEPGHVDLSGATWDIHSDMTWFEEAFAKEIALLKTAFDDVQVKWGLHQWYH
jgi:hypothetical protein